MSGGEDYIRLVALLGLLSQSYGDGDPPLQYSTSTTTLKSYMEVRVNFQVPVLVF